MEVDVDGVTGDKLEVDGVEVVVVDLVEWLEGKVRGIRTRVF